MSEHDDEQRDAEDDPMNSGLHVAERDLLQQLLHSLPDTPPPRAVWERIEAQARAEGLLQSRSRQRPLFFAGAGLAAAVLLAVFAVPPGAPVDDGPFPTEPPYRAAGRDASLAALQVRSRLLEQDLRAMPAAPRVMRAGTAVTIGELEDGIAAIDLALSDPSGTLTDEQTERLWRERVRLMDSLVRVRYAHARRNSM